MKNVFQMVLFLLHFGWASTSMSHPSDFRSCHEDKERREARSGELSAIVDADQNDRAEFFKKTPRQVHEILKRDEQRRRRVEEIYREGCFTKARDFAAGALVFQHGHVAEHYFQAFVWAKRAVELGDNSQKRLMALAIDRYLVNRGHKQLFATQASKQDTLRKTCWCLEPIEMSFPDGLRAEIAGSSLSESFHWLNELNKGLICRGAECLKDLKDSPQGTVPGFW